MSLVAVGFIGFRSVQMQLICMSSSVDYRDTALCRDLRLPDDQSIATALSSTDIQFVMVHFITLFVSIHRYGLKADTHCCPWCVVAS